MQEKKYTRFERSRIIGARALQISMGAPVLNNEMNNLDIDPLIIAMDEYEKKIIPITTKKDLKIKVNLNNK